MIGETFPVTSLGANNSEIMSEKATRPPAKATKRAACSLLKEMDDAEELEVPEEPSVGLSVATVANIVRSEIQQGLAAVEQQLATMQTVFGERLGLFESSVPHQNSRIEKLERAMVNAGGTPRSIVSDRAVKIERQINDLVAQVQLLRGSSATGQQDYSRTTVVGGFHGLTSLQQATTCQRPALSKKQQAVEIAASRCSLRTT